MKRYDFDLRRTLIIPGDREATLTYCIDHWIKTANKAIEDHGFFAVALSGGSTPKLIFQRLSSETNREKIDWSKVLIFWSDERSVAPNHPDSNYRMAMEEGGLAKLPIPKENIFRMKAEKEIEANALDYEKTIKKKIADHPFDLIMLGVGEDGHTASLFPHTAGLHVKNRLVIANSVPQKKTWRMSFTFECINSAHQICLYLLGKNKAEILKEVLTSAYSPDDFPSQKIGTKTHKAQWIIDKEAGSLFLNLQG